MPRLSIALASLGLAEPGLVERPVTVCFEQRVAVCTGRAPAQPGGAGHQSLVSRELESADALVRLIDAEVAAMQVAGEAIQEPQTPDLAQRANAAGARVLEPVVTYVHVIEARN